jgi:hypothetical protein
MRRLMLAASLVLAGCASPQARLALPPEPTMITPRPGATIPVARQYAEIVVRAYLAEAGERREVGGATCTLAAPSYTAAFRTPARVVVPVPAAGAPALDVACRTGTLSGSARRGVVRAPVAWDPVWRRSPWGYWDDPFYRPWHRDPWRRSELTLGLELGPPGWERRRGAAYYPDVAVDLR